MAYQLPALASRSETDLASLWFDLDAADALPSPANASHAAPTQSSPARNEHTQRTDLNGSFPADSTGFRPALPTKTSKGPNSPHSTGAPSAALPTVGSTSAASSSTASPSTLAPPPARSNGLEPDGRSPPGRQQGNVQPPPRLTTDLSTLQLLPPLPTLTTPISPTSPALGSPSYRLARSTSRHTPSNSDASFFQDPAKLTSVSPPRTPLSAQPSHYGGLSGANANSGVGARPTKFVPTISDAAKLDRSRTLVRNLMGTSPSVRRPPEQSNREGGENEARGSARGGGQQTSSSSYLGYHDQQPKQAQVNDSPRSRAASAQERTGLPSSPAAGREERTSATSVASAVPARSPPVTVQSFSSFMGSDGQPRRVLIDGRLFEFSSDGTSLRLVDQPPPAPLPVTVNSPPQVMQALPLASAPKLDAMVDTSDSFGPASSTDPNPNVTREPPPRLSTLTTDPASLLDKSGRASQQFYGDLLGDFSASPTVESLTDRRRESTSGSRLFEGSPDNFNSSATDAWSGQTGAQPEAVQPVPTEQPDLPPPSHGVDTLLVQQPPSKRAGIIEPKTVEGSLERKKVVSSSEQLRKLEEKYGIPHHEPKGHASRPSASSTPMSSPPVSSQDQVHHLQARTGNHPSGLASPSRLPPVRHHTSPPPSTSGSSSPTKPSFPPTLESKLSSSSVRSQQLLPFQSGTPIAHPHQPPFQINDQGSSHPLPPPPAEKSPPPRANTTLPSSSPPRAAARPSLATFASSEDDDSSSDDGGTPLAFTPRSHPPPPPPKEQPQPSSSQHQQQTRRLQQAAQADDWVLPSPIEASSSSRPSDPYEVLSRPMPRELDLGNKFGEKLKRGVSGWRKEAGKLGKKGITQVQALRPVGATSPTSPMQTLARPGLSLAPQDQSHSHSSASHNPPNLHSRTNSSDPHHASPTDQPPRPPSPMRNALDPMSYTATEVAQRAGMIEDEEERKLAEAMFM